MITARETCQQPCFCDLCLWITLSNLIDDRARMLDANMLDGYELAYESKLAEEIVYAIPAAQRDRAFECMISEPAAIGGVLTDAALLLDECESSTYEALGQMSDVLVAVIRAQHREPWVLKDSITSEISRRREWLVVERELGLRSRS